MRHCNRSSSTISSLYTRSCALSHSSHSGCRLPVAISLASCDDAGYTVIGGDQVPAIMAWTAQICIVCGSSQCDQDAIAKVGQGFNSRSRHLLHVELGVTQWHAGSSITDAEHTAPGRDNTTMSWKEDAAVGAALFRTRLDRLENFV
jgi:hypothetical protein